MLPGFFLYEISRKLLGEFVTASCIQRTWEVVDYRGIPSLKRKVLGSMARSLLVGYSDAYGSLTAGGLL